MRAGDFSSSLAQSRAGLHRWREGAWGCRFRLLSAENLIILGRQSEARLILENPRCPPDPALQARWKMDRGRLFVLSQPAQARELMREALPLAVASRDLELVGMVNMRLGELGATFDERETYYNTALADAEHRHDVYLVGWACGDLGYDRLALSRFDEAIPYFERERQAGRQCGARSLIATAEGNLGWCYFRLGNLDSAMESLSTARDLSAAMGLRDYLHRWLGDIGVVYMVRGDLNRAAAFQQRAAVLARQLGNRAWEAIALNNLSEISLAQENLDAARAFNRQAREINQSLHDEWSLVYSDLFAAEIEMAARRYPQAEAAYKGVIERAASVHAPDVLWQAQGNLARLYQDTQRPRLAEAEYRAAIRTIDQQWNHLAADDWKASFLAPNYLIELFQHYIDFLLDKGESEKALEVAESSRARLLNQRLEHQGAVPPNFDIHKLLAAAHRSETVILSYWLSPERSSLWVIASRRLFHFFLPPESQIADLVRRYTDRITQGGDPLARPDAASSGLYQDLLAPVSKLIPPGSNVIIVPDGPLHQLNFETLIVPGSPPHYWIDDVAVAIAPSLRALGWGALPDERPPRLLLLGDPVLTGHEFPPLPNVPREIAAVEQEFPASARTVFTGARAVPAAYAQASPAKFTDIYFGTHATANRESPLNSAIILSHQGKNYKLYARDVARCPLTADLVTLSACQSAGATAYSGEGLMGFAWAFLQAGARNVIATLWNEDDASSVGIMRRLYAQLAAGHTPARALRSAKLALMRSGPRGRLPYYWAPLVVFTTRIERVRK